MSSNSNSGIRHAGCVDRELAHDETGEEKQARVERLALEDAHRDRPAAPALAVEDDAPHYGGGVAVVLVTGMSGTGKSAALAELARRGHWVVDTDYGAYSEEVPSEAGGWEQLWREDRIEALLDGHDDGVLFISGCVSNQGKFYPRFDAVVLLTVPANVILERVASRESNAFGKRDAERDRILYDLATVEPLLRAGATAEIDTRAPLDEVVDRLESIADTVRRSVD
jgi:broad-specificity NMP kinase